MSKVAVVTRTKDRPLMLPRVRSSIESQDFRDFTWVLVNDAGAREPVDAVAAEAAANGINVQTIHRQQSTGMEAASNDGIRESHSEYLVIHDDDDSWEPGFLAAMVSFLDASPEMVGVVCHSTKVVESIADGVITEHSRSPYNEHLEAIHLADMLVFNTYAPISFLFRRSLYDSIGGFNESLPVLGDWDFNLRALLEGDIALLPQALANYHFREQGTAESAYGNSLNAGIDKHVAYDAIYRHRKLREDLAENRLGLGFLLQQGRLNMQVTSRLDSFVRMKNVLKRGLSAVGMTGVIKRLKK